ncbi:MAG: hypothetical protein M5U32_18355 [Myxococcota bacterium]|nr:hypothetical protein [Myxococcota bacterium]
MAKSKHQTAEKAAQNVKTPDFIAYAVIDRNGGEGKARWREIGSAWVHSDGNGIQVRLDAFPVDGTVTLRVPLPPKSDA